MCYKCGGSETASRERSKLFVAWPTRRAGRPATDRITTCFACLRRFLWPDALYVAYLYAYERDWLLLVRTRVQISVDLKHPPQSRSLGHLPKVKIFENHNSGLPVLCGTRQGTSLPRWRCLGMRGRQYPIYGIYASEKSVSASISTTTKPIWSRRCAFESSFKFAFLT